MAVVRIDGIEPHLRMLADYQRLVFENDPVVRFQQFCAYEPVDGIDTENSIELRNSRLSGFRLHQTSAFDDTFSPGVFKLQYFETDGAGTDIFTYDEDGLTFNTPVAFDPSQEFFISPDYTPPPNNYQSFIFPTDIAEFSLINTFNYIGDISSTRLNLLNSSNYGYRFNHITGDSSAPYGVVHFQLVDNVGSATEVFYVDSSKIAFVIPLNMNTQKITGLATPTTGTDATNKTYVDGLAGIIPTSYNVSGASQSFNFTQQTSIFQIKNSFNYTGLSSSTNLELLNYQLFGFRFNHDTTDVTNTPYGVLNIIAVNAGFPLVTLMTIARTTISINISIVMNSQILMNSQRLVNASNISVGTSTTNGQLQFSNTAASRKIVLYEGANNDFQNMGFGTLSTDTLAYQVNATTSDHVWYAGASSSTRNELLRVKGNGDIIMPDTGAMYAKRPLGSIYASAAGLYGSLTASTWTKITNTTLLDASSKNFTMPSSGVLTYGGSTPITGFVVVTGSFYQTPVSGMSFAIYKNGVRVTQSQIDTRPVGAGPPSIGFALSCPVSLSSTDYIEVWMMSDTTVALNIQKLNVTITSN